MNIFALLRYKNINITIYQSQAGECFTVKLKDIMKLTTNHFIVFLVLIILGYSITAQNDLKNSIQELKNSSNQDNKNLRLQFSDLDLKLDSINNNENNHRLSDIITNMSESIVFIMTPIQQGIDPISVGAIYVDGNGGLWSSGTGFVIKSSDSESYILTAYHVVGNSSDIQIISNNQSTIKAVIFGSNPDMDIAVLYVPIKLKPVKLGKLTDIQKGAKVAFTGYPLGGPMQVTHDGIISFIGMRLNKPAITINSFVNHGNSGGPLFLADTGEVIGLINAREGFGINSPSPNIKIPENFSIESKYMLQTQQQIYDILSKAVAENSQVGIGIATPIDEGILANLN